MKIGKTMLTASALYGVCSSVNVFAPACALAEGNGHTQRRGAQSADDNQMQKRRAQSAGDENMQKQSAQAHKKVRNESAQHAMQRVRKEREVTGKVLNTKTVGFRGTDQANQVVLLQTKKHNRHLDVDLGPKEQLEKLNIKQGQNLAVRGRVINVGDRQVLVADKIKRGDKTLDIDRTAQLKRLKQAHQKAKAGNGGGAAGSAGTDSE